MTEITVQIVEGGSKWQRQVSVRVKNGDKLEIVMKVSWRMLKQNWNVKGKYLRAVGIVSREGKCFRYMRTRHRVRTEEWSGGYTVTEVGRQNWARLGLRSLYFILEV